MAEKKAYMVGNIRLSDLNGFEDTVKQGVRGCFIPYDQNPSLYIGVNRQTGAMTVDMDILVRETKSSKTGASHFVKLSVGKANRERFHLFQEAVDSLKIVGNIYTRTPGQRQEGGTASAGGLSFTDSPGQLSGGAFLQSQPSGGLPPGSRPVIRRSCSSGRRPCTAGKCGLVIRKGSGGIRKRVPPYS